MTTLTQWLAGRPIAVAETVLRLADAFVQIADDAQRAPLAGLHGAVDPGARNVQGEVQHKLDVHADRLIGMALERCPHVAAWASEEQPHPVESASNGTHGELLALFDPLDGSSNVEIGAPFGTIFSLLPHPFRGTPPGEAAFLQPGRRQLAAGYALYGAATMLVLTLGDGVAMFALDRASSRFVLMREGVQISPRAAEFAINLSNQRFWEKPVQRYVAECVAGAEGPRARDFNMRWVACLLADVHRILMRGGVYLYPRDHKLPRKPGRLRLLYEAAPMALLIEQAGGAAVNGTAPLLDVVPEVLHQRVPVILGAREEVERIVAYHADTSENVTRPLFKTRSLFVQPNA
jgi:fructose-1,6-bisphosphatase